MHIVSGVPMLPNCDLKFPSASNTWMRLLPTSATYTLPCASTARLFTPANWPFAEPVDPHCLMKRPSFSNFATRFVLPMPSAM